MALKKSPLQRKTSLKSNSTLERGCKLKKKSKTQEQRDVERAQQDAMWEVFELHWHSKPHICENCQQPIWGENKSLYHHHCWPKHSNPQYRYVIEGLMLLCWQCHANIEGGNINKETQEKIDKIKKKVLEISG